MDSADGEKYERNINELQKNQENQKEILIKQISLTDQILDKFNKSITALRTNQKLLKSRLEKMEDEIKKNSLQQIEMYSIINMHTIFLQITAIANLLLHITNTLEDAVTFAKLETFHPSIMDPEDLEMSLKFINNEVRDLQLPFEPTKDNLLLFEEIITVKAYQINTRLVFIIEVPLTDTTKYDYYHLYPLPMKIANQYQVILPQNKFLLFSETNYITSDEQCKRSRKNDFICNIPEQMNFENSLCESQLISFSKTNNCKPKMFTLDSYKIQKIDHDLWIIVTTHELIGKLNCNHDNRKIPLLGTYTIQLPANCEMQIDNKKLKTNQYSNSIFQIIQLPMVNVTPSNNVNNDIEFPKLQLENVELDDVQQLREKLKELPNEFRNTNYHVYAHASSFTFIILLIIVLIIIFVLYKYSLLPKICKKNKLQVNDISLKPIEIMP